MFKRKTYTLEITYSDNTLTTHRNVSDVNLSGNILSFVRDGTTYKCNWDKIYGYGLKEAKR
jgi:hypothetical protein